VQGCPMNITKDSSCEDMQRCSHGEAIVHAIMNEGSGDKDVFLAGQKWLHCTERKNWTPQQWDDDCTRKGWFPVGHIAIGQATFSYRDYKFDELAGDVTTEKLLQGSTEYCVVHKTNPDYAYYYNGQGFVYSRNRCIQDRNGDGTHETAIWGDDNCSPQGATPMDIPKWVAPWEWPKP